MEQGASIIVGCGFRKHPSELPALQESFMQIIQVGYLLSRKDVRRNKTAESVRFVLSGHFVVEGKGVNRLHSISIAGRQVVTLYFVFLHECIINVNEIPA